MFESSLLGLGPKRRNRRWYAFPIAVGLHLSVAAFVLGAQYWQVGEIHEPRESSVYFVTMAPPPPPPLAGSSGAPKPPEPTKPIPVVTATQGPVQPEKVTELPETEPLKGSSQEDLGGDPDGDVNGDPNGKKDGVVNGDPDSDFNPGLFPGSDRVTPLAPEAPHSEGPIHITARVKKPVVIESTRISPRYTEAARRARLQGSVIVQAVIDERGNVTEVEVLRGLPMGLDKSAVEAVSQWKFTPATLEGRAVKVYYALTVYFEVK
jgi:protein TonB